MCSFISRRHGGSSPRQTASARSAIASRPPVAVRAKHDRSTLRFERVYRLRGEGRLDPLICFPPGIGLGWGYAGLRRVVNRERPIYSLQALGLTDGDRLPPTVAAAVDRYL